MTRLYNLIRLILGLGNINIYKTFYYNLYLFPFKVALKFPIFIGKRTHLARVYPGCVQFLEGCPIHRGMVKLGVSPFLMYSDRSMYTLVRLEGKSHIVFGDNVTIHNGVRIIGSKAGKIIIGNNVLINQNALLYCALSVTIGDNVRVGWDTQIYDSNFHLIYNKQTSTIKSPIGKVVIGHNCWLANRVTMSKGSCLPPFTIVCSNSLVNRNFISKVEEGTVLAGSPASPLKSSGNVRILNSQLEYEMFEYFIETHFKDIKFDIPLNVDYISHQE